MSPADALWWSVIAATGLSVLTLGCCLTHIICDADALCPRVLRELPAHARHLAADAAGAARPAALTTAVALLLLAHPKEATR